MPNLLANIKSSAEIRTEQRTKAAQMKQQLLDGLPDDYVADAILTRLERLTDLINKTKDNQHREALTSQIDSLLNLNRNTDKSA